MGILSGFRKQKRFTTNHKGDHQLVSTWTHADTVEMPDGTMLSDISLVGGKVEQIPTSSGSNYEILFSETGDNTLRTESARKTDNMVYNPTSKDLTIYGGNDGRTQYNGGYASFIHGSNTNVTPYITLYHQKTNHETKISSESITVTDDWTTSATASGYVRMTSGDITTDSTWDGTNTSLKTAITNKLDKSGGTITGNLVIGNDSGYPRSAINITQTSPNPNIYIVYQGTANELYDTRVSKTGVSVGHNSSQLQLRSDDIVFSSAGNVSTWDGTHTSLKDTINACAHYQIVTQAQYDALPSSKTSDGIMYFING